MSRSTPKPCAPNFLAAVMTMRPSPEPRSIRKSLGPIFAMRQHLVDDDLRRRHVDDVAAAFLRAARARKRERRQRQREPQFFHPVHVHSFQCFAAMPELRRRIDVDLAARRRASPAIRIRTRRSRRAPCRVWYRRDAARELLAHLAAVHARATSVKRISSPRSRGFSMRAGLPPARAVPRSSWNVCSSVTSQSTCAPPSRVRHCQRPAAFAGTIHRNTSLCGGPYGLFGHLHRHLRVGLPVAEIELVRHDAAAGLQLREDARAQLAC